MAFSDADKQFILGQLAYDASAFVTKEYGEAAAQEFFILFSAGFTKEEWQAIMNLNKTIDAVFARRRFELNRMMFKPEHLDEIYKKGFPASVDFSHIPAKTLQLGLLLSWQSTRTIKRDDEPDDKFEKRKANAIAELQGQLDANLAQELGQQFPDKPLARGRY